jgi:O-antigen/teichoic acid export membrane protein
MQGAGSTLAGRLRFLAKDSVIYGVGGALNKAVTLITFPILARHFSVKDFGVIDLLNTLIVLVVTLLVFGQDSAVARFFYEHDDVATRRQVVSQSFALQLGTLILAVPLLLVLSAPLALLLDSGEDGLKIVRQMILQVPFFLLINFSQGILKWTFKRWHFLFISVGSTLATLAGLLITLALWDLSVVELFTIYLAVRAMFGLIGLWFVRRWLTRPTGYRHLRQMISFAIPFGVICVVNSALPVLERNVAVSLVSAEALGLFAAGAKVAMLIGIAINAFETSWGPFSLAIYREPDAARTFRWVFKLVAAGLCTVTLLLAAFGDLIVVVLGSSKYQGAGVVVFALTMGLAVQCIGSVTEVGIVFAKKSHLKLYAYGVGLAVAALAMPVLGTRYGIVGVAWGSLAGYVSKALVEGWLAQSAHQIEWRFAGPVGICLLTLLIGLVHQVWFDHAVFLGVRWIPLVGLASLLAAGWFFLLDAEDRTGILARWCAGKTRPPRGRL